MAVTLPHPGTGTRKESTQGGHQGHSPMVDIVRVGTTLIALGGAVYGAGWFAYNELGIGQNFQEQPIIGQCTIPNGIPEGQGGPNATYYLIRGVPGTDNGAYYGVQTEVQHPQQVQIPLSCTIDMNTLNLRGRADLGYQGVVVENANGTSTVVAETPKPGQNVELKLIPEGATLVNGQIVEVFAITVNGHVVHVAVDLGAPNAKVKFDGAYGKTASEFAAMLNTHAGTPVDIIVNAGQAGSNSFRMVSYLANPASDPSTGDVPQGVGLYFGLGNTKIDQSTQPAAVDLPNLRR